MIAFLDTSVVLRMVLGEPGPFPLLGAVRHPVVSALCRIEAVRRLDRLEHAGAVTGAQLRQRREAAEHIVARCEVVRLDDATLARAAGRFPTPIRTLDALHLGSAAVYRERTGRPLAFVTHDRELGRAARALEFEVHGVQ